MAEQQWGHVIARGSTSFIALVRSALDECVNVTSPVLEDRLPRDFAVEEHTKAEFRAAGYVFADGSLNEGRVVRVLPTTILWVRADIAKNKPRRAKHIARHEIFHVFPTSIAKQLELMALMTDADGNHPTRWRGPYKKRPEECHADTCAEAASGKDSPWDDFDFYELDVKDTDLPKFLEITLRTDTGPAPAPSPAPPPLPPVDPEKEELKAQVTSLTAARDVAQAKLAIAKTKATEIVAL